MSTCILHITQAFTRSNTQYLRIFFSRVLDATRVLFAGAGLWYWGALAEGVSGEPTEKPLRTSLRSTTVRHL